MLAGKESPGTDSLTYDLSSGYPVKGLETLTREFLYRRGLAPSLTVTDAFAATRPVGFETALITFGKIEPAGANRWRITEADRSAIAEIRAKSGAPLKASVVTIRENIPYPRDPVRLGVSLAAPAKADSLIITITPDR